MAVFMTPQEAKRRAHLDRVSRQSNARDNLMRDDNDMGAMPIIVLSPNTSLSAVSTDENGNYADDEE
jgi:hypothetical protein